MESRIEELERLIEWYNHYVDYVEYNFRNKHDEACEYADKRQGDEDY